MFILGMKAKMIKIRKERKRIVTRLSIKGVICVLFLGVLSIPLYSDQRFAYVISRDWEESLLSEVWVVQPGKSVPEHIKTYLGRADVSWLPKGDRFFVKTKMYFGYSPLSITRVWILKEDGSDSVINLPFGYDVLYFEVSADAKKLVFCGRVHEFPYDSFNSGIWVCDINGDNLTKLLDGDRKTLPAWSPDSKSLIVADGKGYTNKYRLKIINVKTREITDTGIDGVESDWSPDGSWIVYSNNIIRGGGWSRGIPLYGSILKYNLKTKEVEQLTEQSVNIKYDETGEWKASGFLLPKWSPDGKRILYTYRSFSMIKADYKYNLTELWVMDADGGNKKRLFSGVIDYKWADAKYAIAKTKDAIWSINVETIDTEKLADLTQWQAQLERQTEEDLHKAVSFITKADNYYNQGRAFCGKNRLTDARNCYAKAIENIARIPKECKSAKISEEDCIAYIKHCEQLKEISPEKNVEKICVENMHSIRSALHSYTEKHDGRYPKSLVDLFNFCLEREPQGYETKASIEEGLKAVFHCIADPDINSGINYTYTEITPDAPDGTPVVTCGRHPGKTILLVKEGKKCKIIKKENQDMPINIHNIERE